MLLVLFWGILCKLSPIKSVMMVSFSFSKLSDLSAPYLRVQVVCIEEKNVKDMQCYLFIPTCCLSQAAIIRYHLISPINTWNAFIIISGDVFGFIFFSPLLFDTSNISWVCMLLIIKPSLLSFVNDTISASAYNISFFELCIHNLFWVGCTITS